MRFLDEIALPTRIYLNAGLSKRLKAIAEILSIVAFDALMYYSTLPPSDPTQATDLSLGMVNATDVQACVIDLLNSSAAQNTGLLNLTSVQSCLGSVFSSQADSVNGQGYVNLQALFVPMIIGAIQFYMFYDLQADIATVVHEYMIKRILGDEHKPGDNEKFPKTLALLQVLNEDQAAELKNLATYISDAAGIFPVMGYLFNIIPMGLYWRMAYLSVPEARNILYGATTIAGVLCVIQKLMMDKHLSLEVIKKEQDNNWQTIFGEITRLNKAVVAGRYQRAEARKLLKISNTKSKAEFTGARLVGFIIALDNVLSLALINGISNITLANYPQLNGTQHLAILSFAVNFFTNYLLQILYRVGGTMSRASVGLKRLYEINKAIEQIEKLLANPKLKFEFGHTFEDPNIAIQFENVSLAIPVKLDEPEQTPESKILVEKSVWQKALAALRGNTPKQKVVAPKPKSSIEKILEVLADNRRVFLLDKSKIHFNKSSFQRTGGNSGVGKSTFFGMLVGLWPYAEGTIQLECQPSQIYYLPQEDLFVEGTLLENIFYPDPIPEKFSNSQKAMEKLYELMDRMNLTEEKDLLNKNKNWAIPLSAGTRKRLSVLRLIMRAWFAEEGSEPKILLLDEPTTGVDPNAGVHVEALLLELWTTLYPDLCIMFIEHTRTVEHNEFNPVQHAAVQKNPAILHGFGAMPFDKMNFERIARKTDSDTDPLDTLERGGVPREDHRLTRSPNL